MANNYSEMMTGAEFFSYNAKLQQKKNALRKELKNRGVLKRTGENSFDRYKYFSEAQYKTLFTELFSTFGLELSFTELDYNTYEGTEKQANGRMVTIQFTLTDIETGFAENSAITGEGMDKGDKAGYKAYTGALKYYLANTFMVATGDDPEKDSPEAKMNTRKESQATAEQVRIIMEQTATQPERLAAMLKYYGVDAVEKLTVRQASAAISKFKTVTP